MILRNFFAGLLLWILPLTLSGQRYISGRITDAENKEPVPGASVFIANTTVGTSSDTEGNYRLQIPGEGSYRLVVSHVGYQSVFRDIDPGNASMEHNVVMTANEMEEVTVTAKVRFRQKDINLFWMTILGKPPSPKTIHAVNPEAVYYYYDSNTQILKVTCRVPLQIINPETGYHIQLVLERFTHNYKTNISSWRYEYMFSELKPENDRQKAIWDKNRMKTYQVSLTNFVKSLYHNTSMEDGFLLAYPTSIDASGKSREVTYENPQTYLSIHPVDGGKTFYIPANLKDLILVCFGEPVKKSHLNALYRAQNGNINNWSRIGLFRNVLETPAKPVRIFPDGTYMNPFQLNPCLSSTSLIGLNMLLPIDYVPKGSETSTYTVNENIEKNLSERIVDFLDKQLEIFPQEKIHLHTDRNVYVPGEKIWFKAYVTDAVTHQYPTFSQYVYVELISPADTLVNRVMVLLKDDMFYGHLPITQTISYGDYTLRAYTSYMENLGDDYFFKKNIRIGNISQKGGNGESREKRGNGEKGGRKDDFDVSFFPEGGSLLEGAFCKVAFKALNRNGSSETISGEIVDEKGAMITSVQTFHAGMGVFSFIPGQEKNYFLKCRNMNGLEKQFDLPRPALNAYALTASKKYGILSIGVNKSSGSPDIPCFLLAHSRGLVLYFADWDWKNEFFNISEESLPAGVTQFVLFDKDMNPLSERLVFSKNDDATAKLEFQTDKASYEKREKVIVTLTPSPWGRAGEGLLSVAITDDKDLAIDSTTTILSTLLLSSELKGYIENPAYYLKDDAKSNIALDYLMLTHGWRRYNIPEIVKGNIENPKMPFQMAQKITGKASSPLFSKPVSGSEIVITSNNGGFMFSSTDEKGQFVFEDLIIPDSTRLFIQALDRKGNDNIVLDVDDASFPALIRAPQSPVVEIQSSAVETKRESEPDAFIVKAEKRSMYDEDMRMYEIEEVVISAPRIKFKKDEPRLQFWANENSDVTIRRKDFEKTATRFVTEILNNIPGIRISRTTGLIKIRGASSLPLVLIDGVQISWPSVEKPTILDSPLEKVSVHDVESIDIIAGASAAMFGVRGEGGIISITTKKWEEKPPGEKSNRIVYTPLGYQKPVEFYSPKYDTQEAKWSAIPDYRTTIFWKPDIVISDDEEEASFEFYTSDFKTTYSVVIEGITTDGRIVRQVEKIKVE